MITNNSFVDDVVHRKMRLHLRKTFNKIYVINLHGDSNKKERTPSGGIDKNVFDIRQGVSITIAIKSKEHNKLGEVLVRDVYGDRKSKYDWLWSGTLSTEGFVAASFQDDYHFFTNRPFINGDTYAQGFPVNDFFVSGLSGVKFRKDKLLIVPNFSRADAEQMVQDVVELPEAALVAKFGFSETGDWKIAEQRKNFQNPKASDFIRVAYRPLDFRHTFYPLD